MLHSFLWLNNIPLYSMFWGFPGDASGKEPTCQCRRHKRLRSDSWVRKIPWRRKWQPTPVLLPWKIPWTEEPDVLRSVGSQRVDTTTHVHCQHTEGVRDYTDLWNLTEAWTCETHHCFCSCCPTSSITRLTVILWGSYYMN